MKGQEEQQVDSCSVWIAARQTSAFAGISPVQAGIVQCIFRLQANNKGRDIHHLDGWRMAGILFVESRHSVMSRARTEVKAGIGRGKKSKRDYSMDRANETDHGGSKSGQETWEEGTE